MCISPADYQFVEITPIWQQGNNELFYYRIYKKIRGFSPEVNYID
jgi:hypothetical protein